MHPIRAIQRLGQGLSFWQVLLTTGRMYSELDLVKDTRNLDFTTTVAWEAFQHQKRMRPLDWHLDLVATGDTRRIAQIWLYAPSGEVALKITEPNSAYILNTSVLNNVNGRDGIAQSIGRVDDRATGLGIAYTWDCPMQQMYKSERACVRNFAAWRPGIADPGALNLVAMGVGH